MKFGFIAHINNENEKNMLKIFRQMRGLSTAPGKEMQERQEESQVSVDFAEFTIRSKAGAEATGKIVYLPRGPEDMLEHVEEAVEEIKKAALELEEWGAEIIGLGGYTASIGGRGRDVQECLKGSAKITTGNTFTATTSVDTLDYILDKLGLDIEGLKVAVVGFPGSIALLITKLLVHKGAKVTAVGRRENLMVKKYFADSLDCFEKISFTTEPEDAFKDAQVVFTATTTGGFISRSSLPKGCIVIDVGEPKDMCQEEERPEVLVVDGGRFGFEEGVELLNVPMSSLFADGFYGCVGETILLALDNAQDRCSVGRMLSLDNGMAIGKMAKRHGFVVKGISCGKKPVGDGEIYKIKSHMDRKLFSKKEEADPDIYKGIDEITKAEIMEKYSTYINPVLAAVNQSGRYDRLYVRAEGMRVWDNEGNEYLDFVGGYGSVNIGHNHPAVKENILKYMEAQLPGILQVSPGYCATLLSQKMAEILPGNLSRTFFCNSGAEAVEGSLKLACKYTGKWKYVYTKGSFHGKTLGALSVTGRDKYRDPFLPLLTNSVGVEYNSPEALEEVLREGDVAAFIVEPVQGEGGIIPAKDGYLARCRELCTKYGALFIVDEVQTGFGRTGKMFAVEHHGAKPDIIACAKSLGGGLVPMGAYITTENIWDEAYGNQSDYLLHTSTFGGNSFCASVALTTLEVIENEKLVENAKTVGEYLLNGLEEISKRYGFIKAVRGQGLLIGIEFQYDVSSGLETLVEMINSMIPSETRDMYRALSKNIVTSVRNFVDENIENVEKYLSDNFTAQFAASLLNEENIISIVTLNNPMVMRIEPPLIISEKEAQRFLMAFENVCRQHKLLDGGSFA